MTFVVNAKGEHEQFDESKVLRTCMRAGADKGTAATIAKEVSSRVRDGMHTTQILRMILSLLEKLEDPHVAAKYDLKGAIMRLGPAGFAFETFFAGVMHELGYEVKTRQVVQGLCLTHEIDIVAESKKLGKFMVECKYKNYSGDYVGVKEALYTYARFIDVGEGRVAGKSEHFDGVWLVTNTKFSGDAEKYAVCKGMKIMGWKQPAGASLSEIVEAKRLYPITVLRSVDSFAQKRLACAGVMLCKEVAAMGEADLREHAGIPKKNAVKIVEEARQVCEEA